MGRREPPAVCCPQYDRSREHGGENQLYELGLRVLPRGPGAQRVQDGEVGMSTGPSISMSVDLIAVIHSFHQVFTSPPFFLLRPI